MLKARREGKNWLIHRSFSSGDEEAAEVPQGSSEEALRKLEEQVVFLKEQVKQKDRQIAELQKALQQAQVNLDHNQQMLAYAQLPWWKKLRRKALPAGDVVDMEGQDESER